MFIEKQDRTIRTLYNQRGWCGLFFLLVKIKLSEAMVTHASSFTVSLTAEVDSDITWESIWGNAKERGNRCWKVFPRHGAWQHLSSTQRKSSHTPLDPIHVRINSALKSTQYEHEDQFRRTRNHIKSIWLQGDVLEDIMTWFLKQAVGLCTLCTYSGMISVPLRWFYNTGVQKGHLLQEVMAGELNKLTVLWESGSSINLPTLFYTHK